MDEDALAAGDPVEDGAPPAELQQYVDLFNRSEFFAAHEVLEDLWRRRDCHPFLQGLILLAAAYEKARRGEPVGTRLHLQAARRYLEPFLPGREGVDLVPLLFTVGEGLRLLDAGISPPDLPRPPLGLDGPVGFDPPPADDDEIRAVARAAARDLAAGRGVTPSLLKETLLRLAGRAGRSRVEPVVRQVSRGG